MVNVMAGAAAPRAALKREGLWRERVTLDAFAEEARGRLVFLATPAAQLARIGAADVARMGAAMWIGMLGARGVAAISPALCLLSGARALIGREDLGRIDLKDERLWANWCGPLLARSDFVVVAPVDGWESAPEVVEVCQSAIKRGTPVRLLAGGAT